MLGWQIILHKKSIIYSESHFNQPHFIFADFNSTYDIKFTTSVSLTSGSGSLLSNPPHFLKALNFLNSPLQGGDVSYFRSSHC